MAVAFVAGGALGTAKATVSSFTTSAITCAAGESLLIGIGVNGSVTMTSSTITDPQGNTYTRLGTVANASGSFAIFIGQISTALSAQALTVNFGASATAYAVEYARFTGLSTTLEGTVQSGASGTALTLTPTQTTDLAVGIGVADTNSAANWAASTNFTEASETASSGASSGTNVSTSLQYRILASAAAQAFNPTATTAGRLGYLLLQQRAAVPQNITASIGATASVATYVAPPAPSITTLTDDFSAGSLDTTKWTNTAGTVAQSGGVLTLTLPSSPVVQSNVPYDVRGAAAFVKLAPAPGSSAGNASLQLTQAGTTTVYAIFQVLTGSGSTLSADTNVSNIGSVALPGSPIWLRIRESSGTTFWDYSLDGTNWTNFVSAANWMSFAQVVPSMRGFQFTGNNVAVFDNFNVSAAGALLPAQARHRFPAAAQARRHEPTSRGRF